MHPFACQVNRAARTDNLVNRAESDKVQNRIVNLIPDLPVKGSVNKCTVAVASLKNGLVRYRDFVRLRTSLSNGLSQPIADPSGQTLNN